MAPPEIYIGATKETLIEILENALREVRAQPAGSISFPIYANPTDGTVTFTDEDTENDEPGKVTIEAW